jgi:excisionase family DNA binding protein
MDESFLTVAEIAALLKVDPMTIGNWISRGELPAMRVGRRVRIPRADFDRLIEAGYIGTGRRPAGVAGSRIWEGEIPPPQVP